MNEIGKVMSNGTTEKAEVLSDEQKARARALQYARDALAKRSPLSTEAVNAVDLVTIATWILNGEDPWPTNYSVKKSSPAELNRDLQETLSEDAEVEALMREDDIDDKRA